MVKLIGNIPKTFLLHFPNFLFHRKLFLDAFSFVGTCGAFKVIKEKAKAFKASDLNRLFLGLAATPRPDACHIRAARVSVKTNFV